MPFGNDIFTREVLVGHRWSCHIANHLNSLGIACTPSPLEIELDLSKVARFENEKDIVLDLQPGHLEVKSRNLVFTDDPRSFPYATAFVDTVIGWDKKEPRPLAVILISQHTGHKLVIPTSTQPEWGIRRARDRVRNINESWYTVDKGHLRRFADLTDWLQTRQERHTLKECDAPVKS